MVPMRGKGPGRLILLEGLRGFAAIYVFIGHVALQMLNARGGKVTFLFQFGQEAVMLFFLLSGFVIYYSVANRHMTFGEYFTRRAVRIYPLYILALLASAPHQPPNGPPMWSNLLMLQDFGEGKPGVWFTTFGRDSALWSLSYEWWFYMMFFPIHRLVKVPKQQPLVMSISIVNLVIYALAPNQISLFLMYFTIWWVGVELARSFTEGRLPTLAEQSRSILALAIPAAFFLTWVLVDHHRGVHLSLGIHPVLELRHYGSALIFLGVACTARGNSLGALKAVFHPFAILAPISYSLYVFHMPLVVDASYLSSVVSGKLAILCYTVILFGLCYLLEVPFQSMINSLALSHWRSLRNRSDDTRSS